MIAIALLVAAAVAVSLHAADTPRLLRARMAAAPWLAALAVLLPAANWLLMSLSLWSLINRYGRVPLREMTCLLGAAWLLNYLPLRPGLLGRVAYHKAVHSIPIRDSIRVSAWSVVLAAAAAAILAPACLVASRLPDPDAQLLALAGGPALILVAPALAPLGRWPRLLCLNLVLRYLDLLVWACRYMVVFALVDHPIPWSAAGLLACIVQAPMLVPLFGNGLGLREWAVGLASGVLPPALVGSGSAMRTSVGLAADLINRAAEVCCAVPIGLACAFFLHRRKRL